jgi:lipopolysaccharide/colanic/teichoic acid biosynthesis glycosyltransferase
MRPGITGLAQVTVRNSASWDDRIVLDVEYIEKFNVFFDAKIICKTFQKIAIRDNIYAAE